LSFLATKAHFSSNWTSRVLGGKGHEFVVELLGMVPGPLAVADHGVLIDADQPPGLAHATALDEVVQDGLDFREGQAGVKQRGALAFGEANLAGTAGEHPALFGGPVAEADAQVVSAAPAIIRTRGVLAAEATQVVHAAPVTVRASIKPLDGSPRST